VPAVLDVTWGFGTIQNPPTPYYVLVLCDHSVASLNFNKTQKLISFEVIADYSGSCNIIIARSRLDGPYTMMLDGKSVNCTMSQNQDESSLTFDYTSGSHRVEIRGTEPGYIIGDINGDGRVDMKDIGIAAKNFGHKVEDYP
jgi:hypothetical protein